ncbi:hypothetical protein cypCar_00039112 [Cyprinus carpio]|nr:hypothetical protein cypCar_00039112 [Cyprinus carpio]
MFQSRPVTLDQCLQHFISSETIKEVECENCTEQQAGELVNGEVLESQRTTFVKQLKLGKLPQCLCIHLQRLTWSKEGTPIKRQEHVQFTEYLSLDRYKHCTAGQNLQSTSRTNRPISAKAARDPKDKTIANGVDSEHCNNNKPLSNGSFPSIFLHSPGLSSQLNLTYDYSSSEYLFRLTAVLVHHGDMHSGHFVTYRRSPAAPCGASPFSSQWLWVSDDSVRKASLQEALSSSAYLLFYERVQRPGPVSHYIYHLLEVLLPNTVPYCLIKRLLLERLIFAPAFLLLFYVIMNALEGKTLADLQNKIKTSYWPAMKMNWKVWTPIQFININYVPVQFRVLFANLVALFWYAYLSSVRK